jgi:DNA-binding HxlR family transcriptional regulator
MNTASIAMVTQKIKEKTNNSLNMPVDFFQFRAQIPGLSDEDITDVLLYLEQQGLIKVDNKQTYHGITLVKNFRITADFVNKYPILIDAETPF